MYGRVRVSPRHQFLVHRSARWLLAGREQGAMHHRALPIPLARLGLRAADVGAYRTCADDDAASKSSHANRTPSTAGPCAAALPASHPRQRHPPVSTYRADRSNSSLDEHAGRARSLIPDWLAQPREGAGAERARRTTACSARSMSGSLNCQRPETAELAHTQLTHDSSPVCFSSSPTPIAGFLDAPTVYRLLFIPCTGTPLQAHFFSERGFDRSISHHPPPRLLHPTSCQGTQSIHQTNSTNAIHQINHSIISASPRGPLQRRRAAPGPRAAAGSGWRAPPPRGSSRRGKPSCPNASTGPSPRRGLWWWWVFGWRKGVGGWVRACVGATGMVLIDPNVRGCRSKERGAGTLTYRSRRGRPCRGSCGTWSSS